ncbi:MAG: asparagine synthase (glutamine-hydrolyzing) [Verrucomicrobiales bacterium]|nr:asparagine synthase (glutamine-hydrolyzing) [Verrucomicrobiales bacterium]
MCGIVGIVSKSYERGARDRLRCMINVNQFRGPDSSGIAVAGSVGLGHNRLAILDLDDRSNQPMSRNGLVLVFNGEIYNYRELRAELADEWEFKTESDTEVILASYYKWGRRCVERFNGEWALALLDEKKGELFLSRDRFGIKPLYILEDENEIVFASEVRNIKAVRPELQPSEERLIEFIERGKNEYPDKTLFERIRPLSAGHSLIVKLKDFSTKCFEYYGQEQLLGRDVPESFDDAVDAFGELFEDSVRLRLRADVPVGVCLSGGLDSSLIAGVVARLQGSDGLYTYSGIAPGFSCDESRYSDAVAAKWKTHHTRIKLTSEDLKCGIEEVTRALDSPVGGLSPIGRLRVLRRASKDVTVVLDGQGGDELLSGYHRFHREYQKLDSAYKGVDGVSTRKKRIPVKKLLGPALEPFYRKRVKDLNPALVEAPDPVTNLQYGALMGSGLGSLLHTEDRLTMWHSMEGRVPFLDHRLVEFCFSSPLSSRINHREDKRLAREFARRNDLVPGEVIDRTDKLGFSTPYAEFLRDFRAMNSLFRNYREYSDKENEVFFDSAQLDRMCRYHLLDEGDEADRIGRVLSVMDYLHT